MIPNTKKTKHLLIGSVQRLSQSSETTMEIYIDNIKLEEAAGEKLLGVVIDLMVALLHMPLHWFASFAFQLKRSIDPYEKAFQKH